MNFTPTTKNIRSLLSSGSQFSIPRFQREYSWDIKISDEFLSDIVDNLKLTDKGISDDQYFLGTMLFIGDFADSPLNPIEVVDGQQRITTITILLSVLSEQFKQLGQVVLSKQLFRYIMMTNDNGEEIRVLNTISSYPYFVYYIQDWKKENPKPAVTEEEETIEKTYKYFMQQTSEEKLKARLSSKRPKEEDTISGLAYLDILKAVRDQVLNCTFISIAAADKDQANRIFAILNAKGKRLVSVDLIKNRIFEILKDGVDEVYADDTWKTIKNVLCTGDETVGLGTFFRHYWASKYSKSSENQLYDSFNRNIPRNADSYKAFLGDLSKNANIYMQIINPKREDYSNRKEYYWLVQTLKDISYTFNVVQARVALLALFDAKNRGVITTKELRQAIKAIENFHFAYTGVCSLRANSFENAYSRFAIALRKCNDQNEAQQVLIEKLYAILDKLFPSYELFSQNFINLSYSGRQKLPDNPKTKYAINQLNCLFSGKKIYEDDGSIEHIYPESFGEQALNIGNLILLEGNINEVAGNNSYTDKVPFYETSNYKWVSKFITNVSDWDESMIFDRANKLAALYYKQILGKKLTEDVTDIV